MWSYGSRHVDTIIIKKSGITTHLPILEKVLNVQILILDHQFKNNFIYKGEHNHIKIFLHLRENHYH